MRESLASPRAYYVKLGQRGAWAQEAIQTGKLRLGWPKQSIDDINAGRWDVIERQLRTSAEQAHKPSGVATTDLHGLRNIAESGPDDVWVTFHQAKLWWAQVIGPVEQDEVSKFRRTAKSWSDKAGNERLLVVNDLPGNIAKLQGFRGTVCRVEHADLLRRVLDGTRSELASAIGTHRASLAQKLEEAIAELHWKDFETLVDLVFRHTGWIRVSVLGQQAKGYDLELREPITGDRYVVQVKSKAGLRDLHNTVAEFSSEDYRLVFFVVHSPEANLASDSGIADRVEIVAPLRLAELAIDAGLTSWLEDKVS